MWNGEEGGEGSSSRQTDEARRSAIELAIAQHTGSPPASKYSSYAAAKHPSNADSDESDDDEGETNAVAFHPEAARGKPEAMAKKLASPTRIAEKRDELEASKPPAVATAADDDDEDDAEVEAEVVAQPLDDSMEVDATTEVPQHVSQTKHAAKTPTPKKTAKRKKSPAPKRKKSSNPAIPTMDDPVKPITDLEYEHLEAIMLQFCRVPLLAEFSRPVSLLHPEVRSSEYRTLLCSCHHFF